MPTFRVKKDKHFTIVSNTMLQRSDISLSLKGLLSYFLSLPDDWDVNVNSLINSLKEGKTAIYTSINEGIQAGYITKKSVRNKKGHHVGLCYTIFEEPQVRESCRRETNERQAGFRDTVNAQLQSNNNTKKENNKAAARLPEQAVDVDRHEEPVSAAALSRNNNSPNNSLIGEKLTLSQINAVKQKLSHVTLNPGETSATLQHAVLTSLVDGAQFTACHPHFAKKLNAICKCYREGGYSPQSVLALKQQAQKDKQHQQHQKRLSSLEQDFRELRGDIQHFERVLRGNLPVEEITPMLPTYAEKKRRLSQLKTEIGALNEAMGQNTNNLSCPEKSTDSEQEKRPLSTDLPTKNVDKLGAEIGDASSNTLGEGAC